MRQIALLLALILGAGLAQAQDVPKRKSGLWEIKVQTLRHEPGDVILANGTKFNIDEQKDLKPRQGLSSAPARKPKLTIPTQ